ncbi:MAG: ferritin-like domain-containing protein, partial [Chloroflexota bacterium]|nr:ferritin-like domain-containing protein [Chloroflexota bacterium]
MDERIGRMVAMGTRQQLSRRRLVGRTAGVAGGSALLLSLGVAPWRVRAQDDSTPEAAAGSEPAFDDPLDVLNYALTLELLENAFYRDGVGLFDLGTDGFGF